MSLIQIPGGLIWPIQPQAANEALLISGMTIDAADERAACVFQAPKAGDIDTIKFRVGTVTTGATVTVGLYSLDTSGHPDIASGALGTTTLAIADTDDNKVLSVTLGTAVTVTAGQFLACVVSNPSSSFGNMSVSTTTGNGAGCTMSLPYGDHYTSSWAKNGQQRPIMLVGYTSSGGLYPCHVTGPVPGDTTSGITTVSIATNTTVKEAGSLITLPFRCVLRGAWIFNAIAAASDYYLKLYGTPTGTPSELATTPLIDGSFTSNPGANGDSRLVLFTTTPTLEANTKYAITFTPNTTTSSTLFYALANDVVDMENTPGGNYIYGCSRNSTGSTSFTEETTRRYQIGLWIDQIDVGTGMGNASLNIGL